MINHSVYANDIVDKKTEPNAFLVDCLNRFINKYNKYPNAVYVHNSLFLLINLDLILGPKFELISSDQIRSVSVCVGHTKDSFKISIGDLPENCEGWTIKK